MEAEDWVSVDTWLSRPACFDDGGLLDGGTSEHRTEARVNDLIEVVVCGWKLRRSDILAVLVRKDIAVVDL